MCRSHLSSFLIFNVFRGTILPHQAARLVLGAMPWSHGPGSGDTLRFVVRKFRDVLQGNQPEPTDPPPIDVICGHVSEVRA